MVVLEPKGLCAVWPTGRLTDDCGLVNPRGKIPGMMFGNQPRASLARIFIHPTSISIHQGQVGLATAERGRWDRLEFMSHHMLFSVLCERAHRF